MSDVIARGRIAADLDTNLLVEAGAGSGKTTCLVERMVNLIRRGDPVERIAAVTFTRKAANELRERFQLGLELARRVTTDARDRERLDAALRDLDNSFLGTIHAFCGRLLRERSLEAGLDPTFEEVDQEALALLREDFFARWLERCRLDDDAALAALERLGIEPQELSDAFGKVVDNPDVEFPLTEVPRPGHARCRAMLEAKLAEANDLMPATEPEDGWDNLMKLIRRLHYRARVSDWSELPAFCDAIGDITETNCKPTQKRWGDTKAAKEAAKALQQWFLEFIVGEAATLLRQWREHRYPAVMRFLERAAEAFALERRRTGRLGFQDLLMHAAQLLRTNPAARAALGERFGRLLVDEFQDTDPIQAEVCLLLTSDPAQGDDWRTVEPRAGALFVVGDPKQSIYRFRRADLETYSFVRERMGEFGAVLLLTRNFRSTAPIARFVNAYAAGVFEETETRHQARFAPMETDREVLPGDGVFYYPVAAERKNEDTLASDAERVASWIAARIEAGTQRAGDFLILAYLKGAIAVYAEALAARNVPVATTGARLPQERELTELRLLLSALADPGNPVLVAAVLEGLFCGCSSADLYAARERGIPFSALHPPSGDGPVAEGLARLYRWHLLAAAQPADLLLERLLDETGLLPYAASQSLGDGRAGTLLRLVETIREAAATGASTLADGIEAIDRALAMDASATLRPGRSDAVRVMNLHQAKGLEAPIVILAAPLKLKEHEPLLHVSRSTDGAEGGIAVYGTGDQLLAHPPGWDLMQAEETNFLEAEMDRLRYVAATRPRHQLLIGQLVKDGVLADESAWAPFAEVLDSQGSPITMIALEAAGREPLRRSGEEIAAAIASTEARLREASRAGFRQRAVTSFVKEERAGWAEQAERTEYDLAPPPELLGRSWGTVVHRAIEAMGRGRAGASLRRFVVALLRPEFPEQSASELEARVARVEEFLSQVAALPEWGQRAGIELGVMRVELIDGVAEIEEGIVDLLTRRDGQLQVLDWKTDGAGFEGRREQYEGQVARYTAMLRSLGHDLAEGRLHHLG